MPKERTFSAESLEEENLSILADLVADPKTTDHLRVTIINKLLESREGQSFFKTMMEEGLSHGECPNCGHENHFLIPEDYLNEMDWVTYQRDPRVPQTPDEKSCPEFQQACQKKKIIV